MLATPARDRTLPRGAQWAFEVKWDGVRALADVRAGAVRLWSRAENEITVAYPELAGLAGLDDVLLDGEVVAMDGGIPSFAAIAERMHVRDPRRAAELARVRPVTFLVFDVLRAAGTDLTGRPYDERRAVLAALHLPDHVAPSPVYDDGEQLWAVTREHGLEGVVAKRRSSTYRPGVRSSDWVKAAHHRSRAALVGGWRDETGGSGRLGAVLLGAPAADGGLRYLGRAGSGLTGTSARRLQDALAAAPRSTSPFSETVPPPDVRGTHWCEPTVVVQVRYLTRSPQGRLRQPVVGGMRDDTGPDPWETP
ncbi:non-homologous end-joining DNA ligase [Cellulomonas persica]|nr:non-homologous end-joining DNA ligase [Cellulomonas persica]